MGDRLLIRRIEFQNIKALRHASLTLGQFTLLVGPNGSGKTTVLQALEAIAARRELDPRHISSAGSSGDSTVTVDWGPPYEGSRWELAPHQSFRVLKQVGDASLLDIARTRIRVFSLDPQCLAVPVTMQPHIELQGNGLFLAGVMECLRDEDRERFDALNAEVARWLPEFDRIVFTTPAAGQKAFLLRTRDGHHPVPASELSQGTLLAIGMLTLAYLRDPPELVAIEEPDRGLHPRLLRDVRDAMYRLAYPRDHGESREPVQVIATTHSPFMLDLYKDHPEEIVIAEKRGLEATFEPLTNRKDLKDLLEDAHLGEVWYSGILGGVPAQP
ncbi:MAG: AAA family ATPase [Planctomycetales bacterium]|nr:AAA family ATPase [Planctomycetales bacterium]